MGEPVDSVRVEAAKHLLLIATDLRTSKLDLPLVRLSEDGVTTDAVTLAGELELIAMQLDFDGCMAAAKGPSNG